MTEFLKQVEEIEINKVSDGYIIYCPEHEKVHYLNQTAAMLLEICDGETSIAEMKEIIRDVFELKELPGTEIDDYIQELSDASLVKS